MQVRAGKTRKELMAAEYSKADSSYLSDYLMSINTLSGPDINIMPYVHCFVDIDGTVYFHNGTKNSYDILRNKLEMLFAIELL